MQTVVMSGRTNCIAYKQSLIDYAADDIIYTNLFTGVHGNYLAPSVKAAGLDPDNLPQADKSKMNFGSISDAPPVADLVDRLKREYVQASREFAERMPKEALAGLKAAAE